MSVCIIKKALNLSAFFVASLYIFGVLFFVPGKVYADCETRQYDGSATVLRVVDGDTLVLADKRKVRLIGVNAPELAHYPKKEEPLALNAKQLVQSLLSLDKKINLKYGRQQKDRYGRTLAHIFLNDGRNLNAILLEKGLASAIVVPPNLQFNECYFRLEQGAKEKSKRSSPTIWTRDYFKFIDARKIDKSMTGFRFIKGKVMRIGRSRNSIWLQLASKFTIRIKRKDFKYFTRVKFEDLKLAQIKNKMIYIRGWVYEWKSAMYIQLRHPAMVNSEVFKQAY